MPHDNEKESRTLIQEALKAPLVRIPAPLIIVDLITYKLQYT